MSLGFVRSFGSEVWLREQDNAVLFLDSSEANFIDSSLSVSDIPVIDDTLMQDDFLKELEMPPMDASYYVGQVTDSLHPKVSDGHDSQTSSLPKLSAKNSPPHLVTAYNNASPAGRGVQVNDDESGYERSSNENCGRNEAYDRKKGQTGNKNRRKRKSELTYEEKEAEIINILFNDQNIFDYCNGPASIHTKKPPVTKLRTIVTYFLYNLHGATKKKCRGLFNNPPKWWPANVPYKNPNNNPKNSEKPDERAHQGDLIQMLSCCYARMMHCFPSFAAAVEARRNQAMNPDTRRIATVATKATRNPRTAAKQNEIAPHALPPSTNAEAAQLPTVLAQFNYQPQSPSPAHNRASGSSMDWSIQDSPGSYSGLSFVVSPSSVASDWSNVTSPASPPVFTCPSSNCTEENCSNMVSTVDCLCM
jgi:hypothetical protein